MDFGADYEQVAANVNSKLQRNADLHKTWWLLSLIAEKGLRSLPRFFRKYEVHKRLPFRILKLADRNISMFEYSDDSHFESGL